MTNTNNSGTDRRGDTGVAEHLRQVDRYLRTDEQRGQDPYWTRTLRRLAIAAAVAGLLSSLGGLTPLRESLGPLESSPDDVVSSPGSIQLTEAEIETLEALLAAAQDDEEAESIREQLADLEARLSALQNQPVVPELIYIDLDGDGNTDAIRNPQPDGTSELEFLPTQPPSQVWALIGPILSAAAVVLVHS